MNEEKIIKAIIYKEILCEHERINHWYYVTHLFAAVLEIFAGADIYYSESMPPVWKRRGTSAVEKDIELKKAAKAILEHRRELKAMEEK